MMFLILYCRGGSRGGPSNYSAPYPIRHDARHDADDRRRYNPPPPPPAPIPQQREEFASDQVKDLLELYIRDPAAFDQYARTYYYGERAQRQMAAASQHNGRMMPDRLSCLAVQLHTLHIFLACTKLVGLLWAVELMYKRMCTC